MDSEELKSKILAKLAAQKESESKACPNCSNKQVSDTKFCRLCGQDLYSNIINPKTKGLEAKAKNQKEAALSAVSIKGGQVVIGILTLISFIAYFYMKYQFNKCYGSFELFRDDEIRGLIELQFSVAFGVSVYFLILFIVSFKSAFAASLIAFVTVFFEFVLKIISGMEIGWTVLIIKLALLVVLWLSFKGAIKGRRLNE